MNCCDYGQCNRNSDCANRASTPPPFQFCKKLEESASTTSTAFYYIGFLLILIVICLIAGISWGLLERFHPPTTCMVRMIFSIACK
jgi:hypothetical protein